MSYVVYIFLFLSLHACNARHLGLVTDKIHLTGKDLLQDLDNSKLHNTLTELKLQHSEPGELQEQEKHIAEAGQLMPLATSARANFIKEKDSEAMLKEDNNKEREVVISYSQEATKIEGWRRQARSTLGSVPQNTEEPANYKENDMVEDVVVMDYAQPHRKPPIHNRKL